MNFSFSHFLWWPGAGIGWTAVKHTNLLCINGALVVLDGALVVLIRVWSLCFEGRQPIPAPGHRHRGGAGKKFMIHMYLQRVGCGGDGGNVRERG